MFSAKNLPCCIFDNSGLNPHVLFWEQKELTNSLHLIYIYTQLTYTQNVTYASLVLTQILCYIRPQPAPTEAVLTFRCHSQTEHKKKAKAAQPHYESTSQDGDGDGEIRWTDFNRCELMDRLIPGGPTSVYYWSKRLFSETIILQYMCINNAL